MPSVDSLSPRRVQMTERSLSAVVPALLLASAAVAQQNPPTPASDQPAATPAAAVPEEAKPKRAAGEEIVVTGSRIRRKDLTTPAPVTVLTPEQFQTSGKMTIGDFLQTIPEQGNAPNFQLHTGHINYGPAAT